MTRENKLAKTAAKFILTREPTEAEMLSMLFGEAARTEHKQKPPDEPDQWLTLKQVAELTRMSERTITRQGDIAISCG
jgi:hypothetical protein